MAGLQSLIASIDGFFSAVTGGATPAPATAAAPATPGSPASPTPAAAPAVASPASTVSSTPPLLAILAADGLARKILGGSDPSDADLANWKLLYLKALESGATITTKTNLLGSKAYFSGGAVATFALFNLDGGLKCSGNAMDYGGFIKAGDFVKKFRAGNVQLGGDPINPMRQLILVRPGGGACQ